MNRSVIASVVAGLFFPLSEVLGLDVSYDHTPRMLQKITHAAVHHTSYENASVALAALAERPVTAECVRRVVALIGGERVQERDAHSQAFAALSLPVQQTSPANLTPQVACVEMDGGRAQIRDRQAAPAEGYWREVKVGDLRTFASTTHEQDPCPTLPRVFANPRRMAEIAREIKGFCRTDETAGVAAEPDAKLLVAEEIDVRWSPEPLVQSVVASHLDVHQFGRLLASAAYQRGFHAAPRKAFVADGAEANWGVWRRHFSHYTPIVDFVHAVSYLYAAAHAEGTRAEGWTKHQQWAQWLWEGQVGNVIAALETRQQSLGEPLPDESDQTPRSQIARSLTYLRNQRLRMQYDDYRRQGLPLTSSYVESTVKRIHRRVKGTEKFWSDGLETMLTLTADYLSETVPLTKFWTRRRPQAHRRYQAAA